MFGYVPGGYARVLEHLGKRLSQAGVRIELGRPVARVERTGGEIEVEGRDGACDRFDHVVVTAAAPHAARICSGLSDDEQVRLRGVRYLGIVCASVLSRQPLRGFYVTNLLDGGLPFTGVIEMSALVRRHHFGENSLIYLPKYLSPEDSFFDVPDEAVEDRFLDGLARVYPEFRRESVLAFRVSRVREVMALPTLGYSDQIPPTKTSVPGLHLVNSAHIVNGTLNVNETIQLAESAAARFAELP
jgi:protoporphyrinogen oxidase